MLRAEELMRLNRVVAVPFLLFALLLGVRPPMQGAIPSLLMRPFRRDGQYRKGGQVI